MCYAVCAFSVFLVCSLVHSLVLFFFFYSFKVLDGMAEFDKYFHKYYSNQGHHNTIREFPTMNSNMADIRTCNTGMTLAPFSLGHFNHL